VIDDQAHTLQELDPIDQERVEAFTNRALQEKAFRLAVARKYFADGKNPEEVAAELGCEEAQVRGVLDRIKQEKISA